MRAQRLGSRRPPLAEILTAQAGSYGLAEWVRVALWCWAHADEHGHARAWPGQLGEAVNIADPVLVSRAVRLARVRGLLDPCSTTACLVLPGHALAPCDARHGDAS